MRKWIQLCLVFCLCLSMVACGKDPVTDEKEEPAPVTHSAESALDAAADRLETMSLDEKIGQIFILDLDRLVERKRPVKELRAEVLEALDRYQIGGLVFSGDNIKDAQSIRTMLTQIKDHVEGSSKIRIPLYLATQEEGGGAKSIAANNEDIKSTGYTSPAEMGANMNEEQLRKTGEIISQELLGLGFNMNIAPLADLAEGEKKVNMVAVNESAAAVLGKEPVYKEPGKKMSKAKKKKRAKAYQKKLKAYQKKYKAFVEKYREDNYTDRCFGQDPGSVSEAVSAMIKGMHGEGTKNSGGLCTVLNMFPGISSVAGYHKLVPSGINTGLSRLRRTNFVPFEAGIDAKTDVIMVSHITLDKIETDLPSSLSQTILSELLRKEMGFQGIIMTEELDLPVITNQYSTGEAVVKAVMAGADMIYNPADLKEAVSALKQAVLDGEMDEKVIDQAVLRILQNKILREVYPVPVK